MISETNVMDSAVSPQDQHHETGLSPFGFIWRRRGILILCIPVALALGYLHFQQQQPVYQSSSKMLIIKHRVDLPVRGVESQQGMEYESMHEVVIRSPLVIAAALKKLESADLPSLRRSSNKVGKILGGLSVISQGNTSGEVLTFKYQGEYPADCPKVLSAVMAAYKEFLGDNYKDLSDETIRLIEQAKDQLDAQLAAKEKAYQQFRSRASLLWMGGEGKNVHEVRLQQIESARATKVMANTITQAQIDGLQAAVKKGHKTQLLSMLIGHLYSTRLATEKALPAPKAETIEEIEEKRVASQKKEVFEQNIFPLLLEEHRLLNKYGADHPDVIQIQQQIELTRRYLIDTIKPVSTRKYDVAAKDAPDELDLIRAYLQSLREKLAIEKGAIAQLDELFKKERADAKALSEEAAMDQSFRSEIKRKERLFDVVIKRLEEINLVREAGGTRTEVVADPYFGWQVAPDLQKTLLISGVLGILAGLGLAFAVDSADRRFKTPEDICHDLSLPVLGHVPVIKELTKKSSGEVIPAQLVVYHKPRGRVAESYRSVRTALFFSASGGGNRVIQVTSPQAGDGKTTSVANLAAAIAQAGKRVVILDADFRRPRCHQYFALDKSVGLSNVIQGKTDLADAIQSTSLDNLSLLACGARPDNPAELLTSQVFQEVIDKLKDEFDFVIIDTPPLLAVTDPSVVAPRVDGTLLVLRLTRSARRDARSAMNILAGLDAKVLGVVVNAVASGRKTYGYGGNRYAYGYGYGYRYGYGYGYGGYYDKRNRGYYQETDQASPPS